MKEGVGGCMVVERKGSQIYRVICIYKVSLVAKCQALWLGVALVPHAFGI